GVDRRVVQTRVVLVRLDVLDRAKLDFHDECLHAGLNGKVGPTSSAEVAGVGPCWRQRVKWTGEAGNGPGGEHGQPSGDVPQAGPDRRNKLSRIVRLFPAAS